VVPTTVVLYAPFPLPPLRSIQRYRYTPDDGVSEGYAYGTNSLGRTACEHASAKLVQFDSILPLVFSFSLPASPPPTVPAPSFFQSLYLPGCTIRLVPGER